MLHCLFIPQRVERPRRGAVARSQSTCFLQQAGREHGARPVIDSLVECVTVRIQANAENIEANEWIAALSPETSHGSPRANADFQGSHNPGNIMCVDCVGG